MCSSDLPAEAAGFTRRVYLRDGTTLGFTESSLNAGGEWRILDGDSFRSFGGVHARTEWIVGSVDRGPVRGILTFDQTGRRLHLRSRSGQDLQSWPNPSPAPLLFQLGGDAAAMGFSKEPPGIWAGPLDGAPGMREVAKLLPGDESSWLYSNDDGSVLW